MGGESMSLQSPTLGQKLQNASAEYITSHIVIPHFSLTPTVIDYREPNVSATMQRPSSVVYT